MLSIAINFLLTIHVIVSFLIIVIVLMQKPKSEGLGAAFGGGMMDSLAGAHATTFLQRTTRWLGAIFFSLTLILSMLYAHQANANAKTDIQRQLNSVPKLPPSALPSPSAAPSTAAFTPGSVQPLASASPAAPADKAEASASPAASAAPSASPAASDTKEQH